VHNLHDPCAGRSEDLPNPFISRLNRSLRAAGHRTCLPAMINDRCTKRELSMTKAIWEGAVLAESENCILVENNHYFPPESLHREFFEDSENHTVCSWKGTASYFDLVVQGKRNNGAAWYYPEPKAAAENIRGYVAFWRGVSVVAE
jgi:uncharacterized protein (DUF427 family)